MAKRPARTESLVAEDVQAALVALERMSTKRDRDNLVRFGITATRPFGVSMANLKILAKRLGRDHALAAALWDTGWYEARCWRRSSTIRRSSRRRRWTAGAATSTTGASATRRASPSSIARRTPGPRSPSGRPARRVRQAGGLRAPGLPRLARQTGWRRAVPRGAAPHRAARDRRTQLREEGCELGDPPRRQAQRGAERRVRRGRPAPGGFGTAAARWVGKGALKELTSAAVQSKLAGRRRVPTRPKAAAPPARAPRRAKSRK